MNLEDMPIGFTWLSKSGEWFGIKVRKNSQSTSFFSSRLDRGLVTIHRSPDMDRRYKINYLALGLV